MRCGRVIYPGERLGKNQEFSLQKFVLVSRSSSPHGLAMTTSPSSSQGGSFWYLLGGILTIIVGFSAMASPYLFSGLIAQFIAVFCLVSGAFLLVSAIFGKAKNHRWLDILSAILRLAVGAVLLGNLAAAVAALTLVLAAVFIAEGVVGLGFAFKLKGKNPAWIWILLNGLVAIILGGMLLAKFPADSEWAIGLLFGINSVFLGFSLVMFALAMPKAQEV